MRRGLVSGLTVLVLAMSMAGQAQATAESPDSEPSTSTTSPAVGATADREPPAVSKEQLAVEEAAAQARETGEDVVVKGSTSSDTIVFMQPDGRMRTESSAGVVRARTADGWEDIDTTLGEPDAQGKARPALGLCPVWVGVRGADAGVVS